MILETGTRKFFGPIEELKQQFGNTEKNESQSLEEIYFATMDLLPSNRELEDSPNHAAEDVARSGN